MFNKFEIVIPVASWHVWSLPLLINSIKKNINPERIIIVTSDNNIKKISNLLNVSNLVIKDENTLFPDLTRNQISTVISNINNCGKRSNWYFQQFIKMAYAFEASFDNYLVWDADTFPLKPLNFWENKKYLFSISDEFWKPYFETINRLFNGKVSKKVSSSFITEHMMINKHIMRSMIKDIENNDRLKGQVFYEKILYAINSNDICFSGFSEFETFGNYAMSNFANSITLMRRERLRYGSLYIKNNWLKQSTLDWIKGSYEIVCFESRDELSLPFHVEFYLWMIQKTKIFHFKRYKRIVDKILNNRVYLKDKNIIFKIRFYVRGVRN